MTIEELKTKIAEYKKWARQVRESAARAERSSDADKDYERARRYDLSAAELEAQLKELVSKP
jgi:hypothetical protein